MCRVVENSLSDINQRVGHSPRRRLLLLRYIASYTGNNLQKTKASIPKLSTMITGLAYAIDSAIKE